jgi:hypothetical protein
MAESTSSEEESIEDGSATPQKAAMDKAGEFVKYLTALATGALVFSADLLKKDFALSSTGHGVLLVAWILLSFAAVGGLVAMARIPMMLARNNFNLEDSHLVPALRGQQICFLFGILALGAALILALFAKPTHAESEQTHTVQVSVPPSTPEPPFRISVSAVQVVGAQKHQHTFMLNAQTGEVWEMVCRPDNKVAFRKVFVEK